MIRIDEIYCNVFLPKIQDQHLHGLHFFDPFGSVDFKDLCSIPPIPWDDRSVRYLFWDQEPLHKETVDYTLTKFKQMYNGEHHIITSERDSEMVDYVVNTYGFIPHYYFFHGWAALDWFRGYDRSFLMPAPEDRRITKTFLMPNRIIAGRRQHRLLMLYHIFKNDMEMNNISYPIECPAEKISIVDAAESLCDIYPDIQETFSKLTKPKHFLGEYEIPNDSFKLNLFGEASESLLYLVTETLAEGRRHHLTEKTFKPICLGMPFIILGTPGSLAYIRSYGFKTFGDFWDESYDDEPDLVKRIEKIALVLKHIDEEPQACKNKLYHQMRSIVEHNYRHFYNGGFEQMLWQELNATINEF